MSETCIYIEKLTVVRSARAFSNDALEPPKGACIVQEREIVGIDVGTTKICVLVGELDRDGKLNIVGVRTCPSQRLRRAVVVHIEETVTSIAAALDRAERLSGKTITTAYVGIAGSHIDS